MTEVTAASTAKDFSSFHKECAVLLLDDLLRIHWLPEAGPTGSRVKFGVGGKEFLIAGRAAIGAGCVLVPVLVVEGWLSSCLSQNVELLFSQLLLPFSRCLLNRELGTGFARLNGPRLEGGPTGHQGEREQR